MEKKISSKVDEYIQTFKKDIKGYLDKEQAISFNDKSNLLKFIYDYDNLSLEKDDFKKRKRIKSVVPLYLRCCAKRANGEQCTRKKKEECEYCGTHDKNRPHGEVSNNDNNNEETKYKKLEVQLQEINGIMYYIDKFNNVYKSRDILDNIINPNIHAKYSIVDGVYKLNN
tara:strand:+ start:4668 stop:5177 length:510 start_codon:yes stop_codon:yes gene_type:complete